MSDPFVTTGAMDSDADIGLIAASGGQRLSAPSYDRNMTAIAKKLNELSGRMIIGDGPPPDENDELPLDTIYIRRPGT